VIKIDELAFSFGAEAVLEEISFDVKRGEILAILGRSGVGKTTLLRCIAGLLEPSFGRVSIDGMSPGEAVRAQKIGFLFQQDSLLEWRTVRENVLLPFEAVENPRTSSDIQDKLQRSLALVGLLDSVGKFPRQLSGGMRQRVALARALAPEPGILLLDEPFAAIDLLTRERIMIELHAILRDAGTPTIVVTHHIEEAIFLSDQVILLGGKPARVTDTFEVRIGRERVEGLLGDSVFLTLAANLKQKLRSAA
jgi:NitT/TauT family transport system ATP-binding protein